MPRFVDNTVRDIDRRLKELQAEVAKLEAARAALVGGRRGPGRPSGTVVRASGTGRKSATTTRRAARARGRRGGNTRANQALALVHAKPGITIPEIAGTLKIEPNYLYRVMPKLVEDGQVIRKGQGWLPVGSKPPGDPVREPRPDPAPQPRKRRSQ